MLWGEAQAWAPASGGFAEPPTRDGSREGNCPHKVRGTRLKWQWGHLACAGLVVAVVLLVARVGGCQPRSGGLSAPSHAGDL